MRIKEKIANGIRLCRELHGPQYPKTETERRFLIAWLEDDVCHGVEPGEVERMAKEILDD
jgi:hypothetical protein